jgi:hypothetical protein
MTANVLQISEGTNSVGIERGIWAFAYVLLAVSAFLELINLRTIICQRKNK